MIFEAAYYGHTPINRIWLNGRVIWEANREYTIGAGVAELVLAGYPEAQAVESIRMPLDIRLGGNICPAAYPAGKGLLLDMDFTSEVTPATQVPDSILMAMSAGLTSSAVVDSYNVAWTTGVLVMVSGESAAPGTSEVLNIPMATDIVSVDSVAPTTAIPVNVALLMTNKGGDNAAPTQMSVARILAFDAMAGTAEANPAAQATEQIVALSPSLLTVTGAAGTSPVCTVRFVVDGVEVYRTGVIQGYDCPDPMATEEISTPTKESTAQYDYAYAGWTRTEGGSSETGPDETIFAEQTLDGFGALEGFNWHYYPLDAPVQLVEGGTYRVIWDGETYFCKASDVSAIMSGGVAIGNGSDFGYGGNGEPFIIAANADSTLFYASDDAASHTVSITKCSVLTNITDDLVLYPAFTASIRYYTVRFWDGETLVDTVFAPYGGTATTDYMKAGYNMVTWVPSNENITGNTDCYGYFDSLSFASASWEKIAEISASGKAADYFAVGDLKSIPITYSDGTTDEITVAIAGFNHDTLADGTGTAGISIVCKSVPNYTTTWVSSTSAASSSYVYGNQNGLIYKALNNTIFPMLPTDLTAVIKAVSKKYGTGYSSNSATVGTVNEKLWLLSVDELGHNSGNFVPGQTYGPLVLGNRYPLYKAASLTSGINMKQPTVGSGATYASCWTRSNVLLGEWQYLSLGQNITMSGYVCVSNVNKSGLASTKLYLLFGFCI